MAASRATIGSAAAGFTISVNCRPASTSSVKAVPIERIAISNLPSFGRLSDCIFLAGCLMLWLRSCLGTSAGNPPRRERGLELEDLTWLEGEFLQAILRRGQAGD